MQDLGLTGARDWLASSQSRLLHYHPDQFSSGPSLSSISVELHFFFLQESLLASYTYQLFDADVLSISHSSRHSVATPEVPKTLRRT